MEKNFTSKLLTCLLPLVVILIQCNNLFAQSAAATHTIRGKVINKKDRSALADVSVVELDKEQRSISGVATDIEGNFALKVSSLTNKVSISLIGYKTIIENINGRTTMNFQLESSSGDLAEVVVVAQTRSNNGMMDINTRNSTIAVAKINAKELEEMSSASIDQALQGRLAGVDIAANSGDPGAGMQIRIRGTSTINGATDPLIVVDGMPYQTDIPDDFNFGTADQQGYATLLNIAPADILDISVLKDAAATAVWGSRASNGVLVITTKRGRVGKPEVTYSLRGTVSKQPKPIPMLDGDQFAMLIPEMFMNRNGTPLNTQTVKEFQFDPTDPYYYHNYSRNTNWIKEITQTGIMHDHNISVRGGGEKARYYASLGYLGQTGTTIGTALGRISTRINLDYTVSDRIKFRTDISYTHTDNERNYNTNARSIAYDKMPNMSVYEYDIFGNNTGNYLSPFQNIQGGYPRTYNPVAMLREGVNKVVGERIIPLFNIQYDIIPKLVKATFDVKFDINNTKNKTFLPQIATGRPVSDNVVNQAFDGDVDQFSIQTKSSLFYTPNFGERHSFQGMLSFLTEDNKSTTYQEQTSNSATVQLQDPSVASRILNLTSGFGQTRSVAALVNAQYGYLDKYIINAAIRGDGNSRFGPGNRYGLFPSLSGRWRVSGEKFMKRLAWVNDLSLRASYGQSGNAPRSNYSFYNIYGNFSYDYNGRPAVYSQNMELRNLKWETITGQNLGVSLTVFKNLLNVDVDIYRNRTTDLFFNDLRLPGISGYADIDMNVGTLDNQGWEINLTATPVKGKVWNVQMNLNFSRNENIIRKISEYYPNERGNILVNGSYKTLLQINNSFGSFYGFRYKGVYKDHDATISRDEDGSKILGPNGQEVRMRFSYPTVDYVFQPGDAMYEDINHDGNINYMDVVYLGNGNPRFTGGFGPTVTYKSNLKLSAFFSYRYGYQLVNGTKMNTSNMYGFDNQSTSVLRRWRNPGDVTNVPRALYNAGYNWLGSDRYVEDASFIRLRTLTARYNFGKKALDRVKMKSFSFYVTAENLLTFTRYTGQDPEVSVRGSDPFRVATDNSMTPPSKNFVLGIAAGF